MSTTLQIALPKPAAICLATLSILAMLVACGEDGSDGSNWDLDNNAVADADTGPDSTGSSDARDGGPDGQPLPDGSSDADADPGADSDPSECEGRDPSIDCREAGCEDGLTCIIWEEACAPESCTCQDGEWSCNSNCDPRNPSGRPVCVEDPDFCADENYPSKDCRDYGCDDGMRCELGDGCRPSECYCDPINQGFGCNSDCNERYECVKDLGETCNGQPNPAGCTQTGCPDGQTCVNDSNECAPSSCSCGDQGWVCTDDCGGGGTCE